MHLPFGVKKNYNIEARIWTEITQSHKVLSVHNFHR